MSEPPKVETCAFCKGEAVLLSTAEGDVWIIRCTKCPAMMQGRREDEPRFMHLDQRDALVREWNRGE